MADFLDEKRKEIQARLKELKPYVEEYELLQAADNALGGIGNGSPAPRAAAARTAAGPRTSAWRTCSGRWSSRPR